MCRLPLGPLACGEGALPCGLRRLPLRGSRHVMCRLGQPPAGPWPAAKPPLGCGQLKSTSNMDAPVLEATPHAGVAAAYYGRA